MCIWYSVLHFFQHKWILSGQPTDMPKKPTYSRFCDFFPLLYIHYPCFYRMRSPLCTMCGVTPPLMNWQNIWKSILIFMYLPSSIFILHKYLAWIFYWQDRRRKIRILLQKGLIFKKNLIEEDLRCSVILNIESTAWDLYCDSFSSQFVHLSVFRDLLICLL